MFIYLNRYHIRNAYIHSDIFASKGNKNKNFRRTDSDKHLSESVN